LGVGVAGQAGRTISEDVEALREMLNRVKTELARR
jgi:hypothetical protein